MLRKIVFIILVVLVCPFAYANGCNDTLQAIVLQNTNLPAGFQLFVRPAKQTDMTADSQTYHVYPDLGQGNVLVSIIANKTRATVDFLSIPNQGCRVEAVTTPSGTLFSPCPAGGGVTSDPFCLVASPPGSLSYPLILRLNPNSFVFQ